MIKENKNSKKTIVFILLSLLVHIGLMNLKWSYNKRIKPQPLIVKRIVLPDRIKEQVVDDAKDQKNKLVPKESKYLSKQNNKVEKETKAIKSGKTKNSPSTAEKKIAQQNVSNQPKKKLSMSNLGLKPQPRTPSSTKAPSQTDDYLPDVQTGLQTQLNTREFQYYSYFERIKDRLRMYWEPQLQGRLRNLYAQGTKLGDSDLKTKLKITLNKNGELSKITVTRASGFVEIDGAALKAFELAAPFPNPPSGMIEKNGEVYLTWSFVVQTKGLSDIFVFLSKL